MKNRFRIGLALTLSALFALQTASAEDTIDNGKRGLKRTSEETRYSTAFVDGTYHALVIGNNNYADKKNVWMPLKTAVNDASKVAELLKDKYAFSNVQLLTNATRRQILNGLSDLAAKVGRNDSVLVFYAGHGWQNPRTKEAFWVPIDAEGRDDATFISNARIREKVAVLADNTNHVLLISDSCFSGTLLNQSRGANILYSEAQDNYFRKVAKRKSVQILAAGGLEYVDDNYRGSGHSPMSYFFIKELMKNEDKYLTFSSLALNVEQLVARNADQTPQSGAMRKVGDEGGQFIFKFHDGNVRKTNPAVSIGESRPRPPEPEAALPDKSMVTPLPTF